MIFTWFKSLSTGWKAAVVVILLAFLYTTYLTARIAYKDHLLIKQNTEYRKEVTEQKKVSQEQTKATINSGSNINNKAYRQNKSIDKKTQTR